MFHWKRERLQDKYKDNIACVSTPLSDEMEVSGDASFSLEDMFVNLSDVTTDELERVNRFNERVDELHKRTGHKLPFYAVCGRGDKPSFRKRRDSCNSKPNIGYISPKTVSAQLKRQFGFDLKQMYHDSMSSLVKSIEKKLNPGNTAGGINPKTARKKTPAARTKKTTTRKKPAAKPAAKKTKTEPCHEAEKPKATTKPKTSAKPRATKPKTTKKPTSSKATGSKAASTKPAPTKPKAETESEILFKRLEKLLEAA